MNTISLDIKVIFETEMSELQAKNFVIDLLRDYQGTEHKTVFCHAIPTLVTTLDLCQNKATTPAS